MIYSSKDGNTTRAVAIPTASQTSPLENRTKDLIGNGRAASANKAIVVFPDPPPVQIPEDEFYIECVESGNPVATITTSDGLPYTVFKANFSIQTYDSGDPFFDNGGAGLYYIYSATNATITQIVSRANNNMRSFGNESKIHGSITTLSLAGNVFTTLPSFANDVYAVLQFLDISGTGSTSIPTSEMSALVTLYAAANAYPGGGSLTFTAMPSLTGLFLGSNNFSNTTIDVSDLSILQSLEVNNCDLDITVHFSLSGDIVPSLTRLNLQNNALPTKPIDDILNSLATNTTLNGHVLMDGVSMGVVSSSSAAARDLLVSRGWEIVVNT